MFYRLFLNFDWVFFFFFWSFVMWCIFKHYWLFWNLEFFFCTLLSAIVLWDTFNLDLLFLIWIYYFWACLYFFFNYGLLFIRRRNFSFWGYFLLLCEFFFFHFFCVIVFLCIFESLFNSIIVFWIKVACICIMDRGEHGHLKNLFERSKSIEPTPNNWFY